MRFSLDIFTFHISLRSLTLFSAELINFASFLFVLSVAFSLRVSRVFYDRSSQSVATLALDIDFLCQMIGND